jgi:hypothetical protein
MQNLLQFTRRSSSTILPSSKRLLTTKTVSSSTTQYHRWSIMTPLLRPLDCLSGSSTEALSKTTIINPPPVEDMVRLWVLAGKISTAELQNVAIRGIGEMRCNVSSSSFSYIYNNTVPDSPLRRLLVDQYLIGGLSIEQFGKLFRDHMDKIPKEMLADIALAQKKLSGSRVQRCEWENYFVRSSDKKPDAR